MRLTEKIVSSRFYELISVVQLGLGTMMMFTGFDTHTFILESVVHCINEKDPERIDRYAGYYGQAALYIAYAVSNLFAPMLVRYTQPKWAVFLGSIFFTLYEAGFLHINNYYFYASSILLGFGFALFYTGHGCYLAEHSTREKISRNAAISWGVTCMSYTPAGFILLAGLHGSQRTDDGLHVFTDFQVRLIFGLYALFAFFCNVTFLLLPKEKVPNSVCEESEKKEKPTPYQCLLATFDAFSSSKIWWLSFSWMNLGFTSSLMLGIYPTALMFTGTLQNSTTCIICYAFALTAGELTIASIISFFSRKNQDFGRVPSTIIGFVIHFGACWLILVSTPRYSTLFPNTDSALLFEPSLCIAISIGFLMGVGDGCRQTSRSCIIPILLPKRRAQGFSISKIFQALGSFTLFFFSPMIDLYTHVVIAIVFNILGAITYVIASYYYSRSKHNPNIFVSDSNTDVTEVSVS